MKYVCDCGQELNPKDPDTVAERQIVSFALTSTDLGIGIFRCSSCGKKIFVLVDKGFCIDCGKHCGKIGETNKLGVRKSYCCPCFAKMDENFTPKHWCNECFVRKTENVLEIRND